MNKDELAQLAAEIFELLKKHDVDAEAFTMNVQVSKTYFDEIKPNFELPIEGTYSLVEGAENWAINLMYVDLFNHRHKKSDEIG